MLLRTFVLFCALLGVGCSQNGEPTLRIGTGVWPGYEPLYLPGSWALWTATVSA